MKLPGKAQVPTMYFIGVTTEQSSIMKIFPEWEKVLKLKGAVLKGIDLDIHADPQDYRDVVNFIKEDELSLGALVTTHKIDLYEAAKDLFDYFDPYAEMFGELSSISKKDGRLEGYAKDPISSGLAMEAFIEDGYWEKHNGELFVMGAGGSAIAICSYLLRKENGANLPSKVIVTDLSEERLKEIKKIIQEMNPTIPTEYHLTPESTQNDVILNNLKEHSVIINATGLGKDRPGSPLTNRAEFPKYSSVWELNYRGELDFLHQALAQKEGKNLHVENGWIYFIHGWTQVISEVFHIDIEGDVFNRVEQRANELQNKKVNDKEREMQK